MKAAVDETKETVTLRAKHRDEEGKIVTEKVEVHTHDVDSLKHVEKKLVDTGLHRLERHSADHKASVKKPPPKKGRGGKYTWEGPMTEADVELEAGVPVLDEGDPNFVDDEKEVGGDDEEVRDMVKGEVEVAKVVEGREGVARVDVDPTLNV
ncbi:hypothetical protein BVRB_7g160420 [Beta vulgaris subsp. vulgaris]|uniref:uncharacterized protein LOC104898501 n=1 Tax=Beta vulgaris subsp. vulgaris TaxID=3555 RepID=UPI00053F57C6|nr:uncharacterized protein LOC104898501 [Beta vulgaris subsp. vulgaris]KMT06360.1 hypothetical protein BVRB_7g160420 [Beta vulgaris subsp. vulgaris]